MKTTLILLGALCAAAVLTAPPPPRVTSTPDGWGGTVTEAVVYHRTYTERLRREDSPGAPGVHPTHRYRYHDVTPWTPPNRLHRWMQAVGLERRGEGAPPASAWRHLITNRREASVPAPWPMRF